MPFCASTAGSAPLPQNTSRCEGLEHWPRRQCRRHAHPSPAKKSSAWPQNVNLEWDTFLPKGRGTHATHENIYVVSPEDPKEIHFNTFTPTFDEEFGRSKFGKGTHMGSLEQLLRYIFGSPPHVPKGHSREQVVSHSVKTQAKPRALNR